MTRTVLGTLIAILLLEPCADAMMCNCHRAYDPANFATLVEAPTLMGLCLNDAPSPATTVYAVYGDLAARDKRLFVSAGTDHDLMFTLETAAFRWMDKHLGAGH